MMIMVKKIRELQFLCAILLFLQFFFSYWGVLFHAMAVILSVIVICNTKMFRCIDARYNYWIIGLFLYRVALRQWYYQFQICAAIYAIVSIYIIVLLVICTYRCII